MSIDETRHTEQRKQELLDRNELLEQFVLGLTNREQTEHVQSLLKTDSEARQMVSYLREQLSLYADAHTAVKTPTNREPRKPEDFDNLDHEMIMEMTERNHSLVIWRYALIAACLLLLGLSGFLFRQNQTHKSELISEQARHAQDDLSHELRIQSLEGATVDWAAVRTERKTTAEGDLLVHYPAEETALLDFSHLSQPEEGYAYFLFASHGDDDAPGLMVPPDQLHRLYPLSLPTEQLRIYHRAIGEPPATALSEENLVVELRLDLPE